MVRALIRYLRGEPEACSVVRVPSVEQEDAKRLHRERRRLIAERVQHVNRIKGLCATQGIYHYAPLRKDRLARLDDLRTGDGRALPTRLKAEIARELKRLEVLLEMIATVETERDVILTSAASTHLNAGKIKMLKRSARSSPPLSLARCSIENLPIAENWGAMWAWDRARFAAALSIATRASARPAIPRRAA